MLVKASRLRVPVPVLAPVGVHPLSMSVRSVEVRAKVQIEVLGHDGGPQRPMSLAL
jgi:hypothetical protein